VSIVLPPDSLVKALSGRSLILANAWGVASGLAFSLLFWLFAWYGETAYSIAAIWNSSDTFAHGYLIVPISAWLIWNKRAELKKFVPQPNLWALPVVAMVGLGWLLGRLAGAGVVQQYMFVLMIPLLAWTVLGTQIVRRLAFPLGFLLFAVPFGEFLLQPLMENTADFTIFALRLSGIPVYREGLFFTLSSGNWSVVEACSGLRYLIASLTLGVLYAYLTYYSLKRRVIFIAISIVVPILANWLRAYLIVIIGHFSNMTLAVGVDHLIYGWVFFGIVMMLMFAIGANWREDEGGQAARREVADDVDRRIKPSIAKLAIVTMAAALVLAIAPTAVAHMEGAVLRAQPSLRAPSPERGWMQLEADFTDWTPRFLRARVGIRQAYEKDSRRAGVSISYYRNQDRASQLISSQNVLVSSSGSEWRAVSSVIRSQTLMNQSITIAETRLRGASTGLLVWQWFWVDGQLTANPYWGKVLQAKSLLFGRGDDGAIIVVYTKLDSDYEKAVNTLQEFAGDMMISVARSLEDAR
jgi:exosortase A